MITTYNPQLPLITHNCNLQLTIATYNSQLLLMTCNCNLWLTIAITHKHHLQLAIATYISWSPFITRVSLRFWTGGQVWQPGKGPLSLPSLACSLGKFWNSTVAEMCFPAFWSCRQCLSTSKKDNFSRQFNHDLIPYPTHKLVHNLIDFRWSFMEYISIRNALWGDSCF